MKTKLILLTLLISSISFAQQTYVPDDNFENYLETHDASGNTVAVGNSNSMGNGIANDNYVTTANINTVTRLEVNGKNISDLTGIEDFTALSDLNCNSNQLTSLDLSQNTALTTLNFYSNDVTTFDASNNPNLTLLYCFYNPITSLDLSMLPNLVHFRCKGTPISDLNIANGNNTNIVTFDTTDTSNLTCIFVDDASYSSANWTSIDPTNHFVETQTDCDALSIDDNQLSQQILLYPNPVQNTLHINSQIDGTLNIYDISGKQLLSKNLQKGEQSINLKDLKPGVYMAQIVSNGQMFTQKLIVNK
jgi:hypothetical protein